MDGKTLQQIGFRVWYNNKAVIFEIVKCLKNRETSFLGKEGNARCIKAHKVDFLEKNFSAFRFIEKPKNLYISVAILKPNWCVYPFSFSPSKRKEQMKEFNDKFEDYVIGYDFPFDFDNPNKESGDEKKIKEGFIKVKEEAEMLKEVFDEYKVPYYLGTSGSGIHFRIPSFATPKNGIEKVNYFKMVAKQIKEFFDFECMDDTIYDMRRIWKCPYSIDIRTGLVAFPLTDEEFRDILPEDLTPKQILRNHNIRNRGLLWREGQKESFEKMLKEQFMIDVNPEEEMLCVYEEPIGEEA